MIQEVVLATRNRGKLREFARLLEGGFASVISLDALDSPPEVLEDGMTFRDNALKKARAVAQYSGKPALADDSGLEVDALGGKPGVYSARYAGENAFDKDNIIKLLQDLNGVEDRRARFVCCLALVSPDGRETVVEGSCEGIILTEPRGKGGFGYDPVFFLPEYGKTMAEIPAELKNKISHRARASQLLIHNLRNKTL